MITSLLPEKIQEQITTSGIQDMNLAESIAANFVPFMGEITELTDKLKGLKLGVKEDAEIAKRVNIDLGKIRSRKDDVKKTQKEYYLKVGKFIDSLANVNEGLIAMGQLEAQEHSKYFERLEADRIAKLKEDRNAKMSQYSQVEIPNLELLPDEVFDMMLANYKVAHEAKIKAEQEAEAKRLEDERIEKEREALITKRKADIIPYYGFFEVPAMQILGDLSEEAFQSKLSEAKQLKLDNEAEQERIRLENERLKKEAEKKAEIAKKQQEMLIVRQRELQPYIQFIRDYPTLISSEEKAYKKEFTDIKKGAQDHWEFERTEQLRKDKEEEDRLEKERKEAKVRAIEEAKKQAELGRIQKELAAERQKQADKVAAEKKAEEDRIKAEQELLKAGDKKRIEKWVNDMTIEMINVEGLSEEGENLANDIMVKFESFQKWAKTQVNKL
jgi:hypothetical protein